MKKLTSIILTLAMCLSLAACGGESQPAAENNSDVTETITDTSKIEESPSSSEDQILPMNVYEAYTCNVSGYEGFVRVESYAVSPDEMNEGCEIRTANVTAIFPDAPKSLELGTVAFVANAENGTPQMLDETAWLIETEFGEELIFQYDNIITGTTTSDGALRYDMILSYMVPEDYDEISFAITDKNSSTALGTLTKSDAVSADTCWFLMGSFDNGVLGYNGSAVATAAGTADINQMYSYGTSPDNWASEEFYEEPYEEPYEEQNTTSASSSKTLVLDYGTACTSATQNGITNEFESIVMTDCSDSSYTVAVRVKYSGVPANTPLRAGLWDCSYTELEVESQESTVSGSGTEEFVFHIDANSTVPPYTFTASVIVDGLPRDMTIYIDGNVQ